MQPIFSVILLLCTAQTIVAEELRPAYWIDTVIGGVNIGDGGSVSDAILDGPLILALGPAGDLYIAEAYGHRIRKVSGDGWISTIVGAGTIGFSGDDGPGTVAQLAVPGVMAFDAEGDLYFNDRNNFRIRRVSVDGTITSVAGTGERGFDGDGGPARFAKIDYCGGITLDSAGNVYFTTGGRVRRITPDGVIATIAGTGGRGFSGDGGPATAAEFWSPSGLAFGPDGSLYIADRANHRIRKIAPDGTISTFAGTGKSETLGDGGPAAEAGIRFPERIGFDGGGNLYVTAGVQVRRIEPEGTISSMLPEWSSNWAWGLAVEPSGEFYISTGSSISQITAPGELKRIADGDHPFTPLGVAADSAGNVYVGTSFPEPGITRIEESGMTSKLNWDWTRGLTSDSLGNVYYAASAQVKVIRPGGSAETIAGTGKSGFSGDGGPATEAEIGSVYDLAVGPDGAIYIPDYMNHRLRKVAPDGIIQTIAGDGTKASTGDGGPAISAQLYYPKSVALDGKGNLCLLERFRIRRIDPNGIITTILGTGKSGYGGDGFPGTAGHAQPSYLTADSNGNVFYTEPNRIRVLTAAGLVHTVGGSVSAGYTGDGGLARLAQLEGSGDIALGPMGEIYVVDSGNHAIRKLKPLAPASIAVARGNSQSGRVLSCLPKPLSVIVRSAEGHSVPGIEVQFSSQAGGARLTQTVAISGNDGVASTSATMGGEVGPQTITAESDGLPVVAFNLTATAGDGSPTPPCITEDSVVGGALSSPPWRRLSPNGIASLFGQNLTAPGILQGVTEDLLTAGKLPTQLGGLCVDLNGVRTPLLFAGPQQVNFQTAGGSGRADVQLVRNCGHPEEIQSNTVSVRVQDSSPELFVHQRDLNGAGPVAAVNAVTGEWIGTPGMFPGIETVPAREGDILSIFGTGFGAVEPGVEPGELASSPAQVEQKVRVALLNQELNDYDILYCGTVPGFAGLYQMNIRLRRTFPRGRVPLTVQVGNYSSPQTAYLVIDWEE